MFDYVAEGQLSLFDFIKPENKKSEIEKIKEKELIMGSGFANGKQRIIKYFLEGHNLQEESVFLKNEYGVGGRSLYTKGKTIGYSSHSAAGIVIKLNESIENQTEIFMDWLMVAKYIRDLIKDGRYDTSCCWNDNAMNKPEMEA